MTEKEVISIKEALIEGVLTQKQIADEFGTSRSTVSNIATGRVYKNVGPGMVPQKIQGGQMRSKSIEEQNIALMGALENLRDERNLLRRQLKTAAKKSSDVLSTVAAEVTPIKPPRRIKKRSAKSTIDETLVMVLSDTHLDEVVTREEVEGLEEFNYIIGARRCEVLVEDTLRFTQETLKNFRFKKLVIFGLGDYGSFSIHDHTKESFFQDVFRNSIAIGQLFANMFSELSPHFDDIEVHNITGNHGRLTAQSGYGKRDAAANYDDLVMRITEMQCSQHDNIKFCYPEGVSAIVDVEGYNFHLSHGHTKGGGSAAWNRAKKLSQTLIPLHGGTIDYMVSGHYHTSGLVTVSGGATLIANGALLACDQFSLQALGEASQPSQFIFGVHKNRGVTWRLPIQVATQDESNGPQRYDLPCLRDWDHV